MVKTTRPPRPIARAAAALACALATALAGAAAAQPLEPSAVSAAQESAWSRGVPVDARRAAEALFQEGNALLRESIFVTAAARYREALARWDHPNIHYNLALALMSLDHPVETREHLVAAMRYGPDPLQKERFEHARNYLALLDKQLARVTIRCDVPGAQVELDGRSLFAPPGEFDGFVRAGKHTLVASKEGFVANQSVRTLDGGTASVIDLPLKTVEELTQTTRRWRSWFPWSVVAAGAAVAALGGYLQYDAGQKIDWIDGQSVSRCPTGCETEPADLASERSRADKLDKASVAAFGVGGAAVVTGAVLLFLNRAHTYVAPYGDAPGGPPARAPIGIVPVVDRDRAGVVATLRF